MPSWVMVPVPDEHVQEVMEFVIRAIARASVQQWDDDGVEEFVRKADEPTRGLLSVVARSAMSGKELSDQMAADFLQEDVAWLDVAVDQSGLVGCLQPLEAPLQDGQRLVAVQPSTAR